ncbi:Arabinogalactan protein 16 [Ranunculus cassubicifolius]
MVMAVLVFSIVLPQAHAQAPAPAPVPTSDGTSIDQGIAYVLMLVALVLTYLIHPLDASSYHSFF